MKIIKVLVDELPEHCDECMFHANFLSTDICEFTFEPISERAGRLPDCPLRLEHDNARVANEVM